MLRTFQSIDECLRHHVSARRDGVGMITRLEQCRKHIAVSQTLIGDRNPLYLFSATLHLSTLTRTNLPMIDISDIFIACHLRSIIDESIRRRWIHLRLCSIPLIAVRCLTGNNRDPALCKNISNHVLFVGDKGLHHLCRAVRECYCGGFVAGS